MIELIKGFNMNNNYIYEEKNKLYLPKSVLERIYKLIDYFEYNYNDQVKKEDKKLKGADIGCGNCEITKLIENRIDSKIDKYDKYPIEGLDIITCDFLAEDFKFPKYDYFILNHVLEHFKDPGILISKLYDALDFNGRIYLSIPNGGYPNSNHKPLDESIGHYSSFTIYSLLDFMDSYGFRLVDIKDVVEFENYEEIFGVFVK